MIDPSHKMVQRPQAENGSVSCEYCQMCTCHTPKALERLCTNAPKLKQGDPVRFGNVNEGEPEDFQLTARLRVMEQYNLDGIGTPRGQAIDPLSLDEVYVVWFTYILGNWKAIVSTMRPDDRIYEVTHNKAKDETYIDTYLKTHNICRTGPYGG